MYILRTRLIENPNVSLYYKGTATEKGVPFALNSIAAFEPSDAKLFDKQNAIAQCNRLNQDKEALFSTGYDEFEVIII